MKSIFKVIIETNPMLPGWCELDKALTLASIVLATRPETSLEIGVFGGRGFLPIALAHKAIGKGMAVGIDPWSREVAMREQTADIDRKWWGELDYEKLHHNFMALLQHTQTDGVSKIFRAESKDVVCPTKLGLLHVDGSHSMTALADVKKFAPQVIQGGFCVTDDTQWTGGGVLAAEQALSGMGFKFLYKLGTGAVFQRL